ncbi:MAG: hypothetical protein ACYCOY_06465 [Metallibacterium sp.]
MTEADSKIYWYGAGSRKRLRHGGFWHIAAPLHARSRLAAIADEIDGITDALDGPRPKPRSAAGKLAEAVAVEGMEERRSKLISEWSHALQPLHWLKLDADHDAP